MTADQIVHESYRNPHFSGIKKVLSALLDQWMVHALRGGKTGDEPQNDNPEESSMIQNSEHIQVLDLAAGRYVQ